MPKKTTNRRSARPAARAAAADSYSNAPARIGTGTRNLIEAGNYPLTRLTHDYVLLLSLYRSSWIARKVVDAYAEDMLKAFPVLSSELPPDEIKAFDKVVKKTQTLASVMQGLKWGRLFGGGINLIVIAGHNDLMEPLELDDIEPGSYKGLIALDRWSGVTPGAKLVSDIEDTANFGLPESYTCTTETAQVNVHHSRVLRFTGRDLPNWERQTEQYWGLSEIELLFDELKKRDYASWNIVSLLTRAQLLTITEPELANLMSGLGANNAAFDRYIKRIQTMSDSMNNQGLVVLGKDGSMNQHAYTFSGVSDVYSNIQLDIAGAAEYPVSRLFGRTATGLGQSGEGDLQVYYDNVEQKRKRELDPLMQRLIPIIAMSTFGEVPDDLDFTWPPVRTLSDKDRADLAKNISESVGGRFNDGIIGRKTAMKELKQSSEITGVFSNIQDEDIEKADDEPQMPGEGGDLFGGGFGKENDGGDDEERAASDAMADADRPSDKTIPFHGFTLHIENDKGSTRSGVAADGERWTIKFKHPYGYIEGVPGADGDSLDCFVGPSLDSNNVFVIHQNKLNGQYDEDKIMLGYRTAFEAVNAYFDHYDRPERFFDSVESMTVDEFKNFCSVAVGA